MQLKKKIDILLLTAFTLGSIVCCTPKSNRTILAFFFDGVPVTNEMNPVVFADSIVIAESSVNNTLPVISETSFILHKPYQTKECDICHEKSSMKQIIDFQPDLCFMCHEDFTNEYSKLHGPIAGGYCTSCHNPHLSKLNLLLIKEGRELCLNCHEKEQIYNNKIHKGFEDNVCSECHNPHGGENTGYLIADQPELCYKCHTDYRRKYAYVHGPVGGGNCTACHGPHSSKSDHKLIITGKALCLHCHVSKPICMNKTPEATQEKNCIECHHPHGGDNKYYN